MKESVKKVNDVNKRDIAIQKKAKKKKISRK
jgi:hypothetical protein